MAVLRSKALLERLQFRSNITRFLKKHIKFSGVTALLEFSVSGHKFLPGIFTELGPVHYHAHLACLQFLVVLLLLVFRPHRTVKVLPLREFQIESAGTEDTVQVIKQRVELQTFHLQFFR